MRRLQLFEIGELWWCPGAIRDALTDYLTFMIELGKPYDSVAPLLTDVIEASPRKAQPHAATGADEESGSDRLTHATEILDLASGAGGPWRSLVPLLAEAGAPVRVRMTDRYPNLSAFARMTRLTEGHVTGEARPVMADDVPSSLTGIRTMFSAFHHFDPAHARNVLGDAATHGASIAIFEATRRDAKAIMLMCLTPIFVLLATPFIRPFRLSRLFLTYVVPVVPLAVVFDGVVSCLRTYTPSELRALAGVSAPHGYTWKAGEVGGGPIPVTYLVGHANVNVSAMDAG